MNRKRLAAVAVLVTIVALLSLVVCAGCADNRAQAARVGDSIIYEDDVNAYTQDFRASNSLTDDAAWAHYLSEQGLVCSSWREQAIRTLAEHMLVEKRAAELGISADAERVAQSIAEVKESAGIAEDDEAAWKQYLEQKGTTQEKLTSEYEYASIEQQVLKAELEEKVASDTELVQEYINRYLMDIVTRRYSFIYFASDASKDAAATLKELSALKGKALSERFSEMAAELSADSASAELGGDVGWDIQYDYNEFDVDGTLVKLEPGQLADHVIENGDALIVAMCTDKFTFSKGVTPDTIEPESLHSWVVSTAVAANWAGARSSYLAQLVDDVNIQVHEAPDDLPYNVDNLIASDES